MSEQQQTVWACKIGFIGACVLPNGADAPMREAVRNAFGEMFETEPQFIFSGWGANLTESELAVVENRLPSHAAEAKTYEALLAECDALREAWRVVPARKRAHLKPHSSECWVFHARK